MTQSNPQRAKCLVFWSRPAKLTETIKELDGGGVIHSGGQVSESKCVLLLEIMEALTPTDYLNQINSHLLTCLLKEELTGSRGHTVQM